MRVYYILCSALYGGQDHADLPEMPEEKCRASTASRQPPASLPWQWCTVLAEDANQPPPPQDQSIGEPQNTELPALGGAVPRSDGKA